jgi:hypothetical protein
LKMHPNYGHILSALVGWLGKILDKLLFAYHRKICLLER